jgi:hypothetical protein
MTAIHNVTLHREGEAYYFASNDGKSYLPITRPACTERDAKVLAELIEGDGNFRPILFSRRYFDIEGQRKDTSLEHTTVEPAEAS